MRVMLVAAHPDDEVLGPGGTLARHGALGDEVRVLILGDGVLSRVSPEEVKSEETRKIIEARTRACRSAADALGIKAPVMLDPVLPDNRFDSVPLLDITKGVEAELEKFKPDIVYTHHKGDLNLDHGITFRAVLTACRPGAGSPLRVLCFETPSSTEWSAPDPAHAFLPNVFVDISDYWELKKKALAAYGEEMRPFPHPRSLEYLEADARRWGGASGLKMAEAFMLVREVVR